MDYICNVQQMFVLMDRFSLFYYLPDTTVQFCTELRLNERDVELTFIRPGTQNKETLFGPERLQQCVCFITLDMDLEVTLELPLKGLADIRNKEVTYLLFWGRMEGEWRNESLSLAYSASPQSMKKYFWDLH